MTKTKLLLLTFLLICFSSIFAKQVINLTQARQMALKNNPGILAEKSKLSAAENYEKQAMLGLFPSASINGMYQKDDEASVQSVIGINPTDNSIQMQNIKMQDRMKNLNFKVSQPIFNGGKIWLGWKMAEDSKKLSQYGFESQKLKLITDVNKAYYNVLKAIKLNDIAVKDLQATAKHLEIAKSKALSGTLSNVELLRLEAEKTKREVSLIQSQNFVKTAKQLLATKLQLDNTDFDLEPIEINDSNLLFNKLASLDVNQLENFAKKTVNFGVSSSFSLKRSKVAVDMAEKSLTMAKGNFLPSLFLSYTYDYTESVDPDDDWDNSSTIMLNASMPIFPIVDNVFGLAEAKHKLKSSNYSNKEAEDLTKLSIKNLCYDLSAKAHTVKAAKKSLKVSEKYYNGMQQRFKAGLINTADLMDSQLSFFNAQNFYLTSVYDYYNALSSLMQELGKESNQELLMLLGE